MRGRKEWERNVLDMIGTETFGVEACLDLRQATVGDDDCPLALRQAFDFSFVDKVELYRAGFPSRRPRSGLTIPS